MEDLLALADLQTVFEHFLGDGEGGIGHLLVVDKHAALLDQLPGLWNPSGDQ